MELAQRLVMAREPFIIVGPPGVGKSEIIKDAAKIVGYDYIADFPPVKDPTDYLGIGHAYESQGRILANFIPVGNLRKIKEASIPTVVVFEEIGKATKATQNAVAQLMLSRQIDGEPISEFVSFCAATNRRCDNAGEIGMPSHFLDRFSTVLELKQNVIDWTEWAVQPRNKDKPDDGPRVPIELVAFCQFKPRDTVEYPFDANAAKDMRKIPTARTMEAVGRLVKSGIVDFSVLAGAAGAGFASAFLTFLEICKKLPSAQSIIMNPESVPIPEESDIRFALAIMLSSYANINNFDSIIRFLNRMPKDVMVASVMTATARNAALYHCPAYTEWSIRNARSIMA